MPVTGDAVADAWLRRSVLAVVAGRLSGGWSADEAEVLGLGDVRAEAFAFASLELLVEAVRVLASQVGLAPQVLVRRLAWEAADVEAAAIRHAAAGAGPVGGGSM